MPKDKNETSKKGSDMIKTVYAVYDAAVRAYMNPMLMRNDGEAMRAFVDAVKDQTTSLNKHPQDYSLFKLAIFNDASGEYVNNVPTPVCLITALSALGLPVNDSGNSSADRLDS